MNFTINHLKVRSNWFDTGGKYSQMKYDAFNSYINLFKFRLSKQQYEYYFVTSINDLKKETGYTKQRTYDNLSLLIKLKIIKVLNVSRWDRFIKNGVIPGQIILHIAAIDIPVTNRILTEHGDRDQADTENDYYVSVDLKLMEYYKAIGLNEKYYAVYCLIKKLSNNTEQKSFMTIESMSNSLGINKNAINKYIKEMNSKYVLYSNYRKNRKSGFKFEHHLLRKYSDIDKFKNEMKHYID
ncbi:hypothetical protein, partial [Paenibacillus sp. Marseille-Q4541]|uniref:hypothetical protein n=1 Tax=Paenibacillus sp. Marseille-Q4541 TaxID=2831522 RepID=UPI001BA7871E